MQTFYFLLNTWRKKNIIYLKLEIFLLFSGFLYLLINRLPMSLQNTSSYQRHIFSQRVGSTVRIVILYIVEPNNMLPNFGNQKIGFLNNYICQKGRYFVPVVMQQLIIYYILHKLYIFSLNICVFQIDINKNCFIYFTQYKKLCKNQQQWSDN